MTIELYCLQGLGAQCVSVHYAVGLSAFWWLGVISVWACWDVGKCDILLSYLIMKCNINIHYLYYLHNDQWIRLLCHHYVFLVRVIAVWLNRKCLLIFHDYQLPIAFISSFIQVNGYFLLPALPLCSQWSVLCNSDCYCDHVTSIDYTVCQIILCLEITMVPSSLAKGAFMFYIHDVVWKGSYYTANNQQQEKNYS